MPTTLTTTPAPTYTPAPTTPVSTITTTPGPTYTPAKTTPLTTITTTPALPTCGGFKCPSGKQTKDMLKVCDKTGCTVKLCCIETSPCATAAPLAPKPTDTPANPCAIVVPTAPEAPKAPDVLTAPEVLAAPEAPSVPKVPAAPSAHVSLPVYKKYADHDASVAQKTKSGFAATWAFPVVGAFAMLSCGALAVGLRKAAKRQTRQISLVKPVSDESGLLSESDIPVE